MEEPRDQRSGCRYRQQNLRALARSCRVGQHWPGYADLCFLRTLWKARRSAQVATSAGTVLVKTGAIVEDRVTVKNGVSILDRVTIDDVFLGPNCVLTDDLKPRVHRRKTRTELIKTRIRNHATIGANATIVCGVTVGGRSFYRRRRRSDSLYSLLRPRSGKPGAANRMDVPLGGKACFA